MGGGILVAGAASLGGKARDVFVGVGRFEMFLQTQPHSLKEKRAVVRKLKDAVRNRLQVSVAEVDLMDVWQRTVLGVAVVSPDQNTAQKLLQDVVKVLISHPEIELTGEEVDVSAW